MKLRLIDNWLEYDNEYLAKYEIIQWTWIELNSDWNGDWITFNADVGGVLDLSEFAGRHAGVVGRFADVLQDEDVLADGQLLVEILQSFAPLDERHRRSSRHARHVQRRARLHLEDRLERDRKVRRHPSHCNNNNNNNS